MNRKENNKSISSDIGFRIKELRVSKKLTQKKLGQKLNLSQEMISKIETGKTPLDLTIQKEIAEFFKVSNEYLLTGITNDTPEVLNRYFSVIFDDIKVDNDTSFKLPHLEIDKSLLTYLINTARAKYDPTIPNYMESLWVKKEKEIFLDNTSDNVGNETIGFIPIPINMFLDDNTNHRYIELWKDAYDIILTTITSKKNE